MVADAHLLHHLGVVERHERRAVLALLGEHYVVDVFAADELRLRKRACTNVKEELYETLK